jgi:NitT/TauT family transport system permease protein
MIVRRPFAGPSAARVGLGRCLVAVALLVIWELGHRALGVTYVAAPLDVAQRVAKLFASGEIWHHLRSTLLVAGVGFAAGWLGGFALPLLLQRSRRLMAAIEPFVLAAMGVPLFALIPLLILWFGIGMSPRIVIVTSMVFFMIFITTLSGLRALDRRLVDMGRILGASDWQVVTLIQRHAMLPFLFAGLKLSVPRAISATIVSEFLVADSGLGFYIEQGRQTADTVGVFAGIVLVTLLVLCSDLLLSAWQRSQMHWQTQTPGEAT